MLDGAPVNHALTLTEVATEPRTLWYDVPLRDSTLLRYRPLVSEDVDALTVFLEALSPATANGGTAIATIGPRRRSFAPPSGDMTNCGWWPLTRDARRPGCWRCLNTASTSRWAIISALDYMA